MSALDDLREKYDGWMESLEEKGVPNPRVLLPGLFLLLLLIVGYYGYKSAAPSKQTVSFTITDASGAPVSGLTVSLYNDAALLGTRPSQDGGKVSFADVPKNADLRVKIEDEKGVYAPLSRAISFETTKIQLETATPSQAEQTTVSVLVSNAQQAAVRGASVILTGDDGAAQSAVTGFDGYASFVLDAAPAHVSVSVTAETYQSYTASATKADLDRNSNLIRVALESQTQTQHDDQTGTDTSAPAQYANVLVSLSDGSQPIVGASVKLKDSRTFRPIASGKSDASGTVSLRNLPIGTHLIVDVTAPSGYHNAVSEEYALDSASGLEIPLILEKVVTGNFINLLVKSKGKEGSAIPYAQATLYDASGKELKSSDSDTDGKVQFSLSNKRSYFVTVYAEGFLPKRLSVTPSSQITTVELEEQTEANSVPVQVEVSADGGAALGAQVFLYSSDGFPLGIPSDYTDAEGQVSFTVSRSLGSIFAKASSGRQFGESSRVQVAENALLSVTLENEPGVLEVSLKDAETGLSLSNGSISALAGTQVLATCEAANCSLVVPSETDLVLVASSPGYVQFSSASLRLSPGERRSQSLPLVSESLAKSVSVKFLGLYNKDGLVSEVGNGEHYIAKFMVTAPASSTNAGLHVHLSSNELAYLEQPLTQPPMFFAAQTRDGTSCYSSASSNQSDDSSISQDLVFPKGYSGSKEFALKLYVKPSASASSSFKLLYKAFAQKNALTFLSPALSADATDVTFPSDTLGIVRTACAQPDLSAEVKVTSAPLTCNSDGSFCARIYLESGSTKTRSTLEVGKGKEYSLHYEVRSSAGIDAIGIEAPNSDFVGSSESQFASATATPDTASSSDSSTVNVDRKIPVSIAPDEKGSGTLTLRAVKATLSSNVRLTFYSESDAKKYDFGLKITGSNSLKVNTAPTSIVAGTASKLRISVLDEQNNGVPDASVTLYECSGTPLAADEPNLQGDGSSDAGDHGLYKMTVTPSNIGQIGVRVEHPDFRKFDSCQSFEVAPDEESLSVSPQLLEFTGDSSNPQPKTLDLLSSLGVKSSLTVSSDCFTPDHVPLLVLSPATSSNFKDHASIDVSVLTNSTAKTSCRILIEQHLAPAYTLSQTVSVRTDVHAPLLLPIDQPTVTPTPTVTPAPQYPDAPSIIYLQMDDTNLAEAYYSTGLFGDVTSCTLRGNSTFLNAVHAECVDGVLHLVADMNNVVLANGLRMPGRVSLTLEGKPSRLLTVIVLKAPTPPPGPATCTGDSQCQDNEKCVPVEADCTNGSCDPSSSKQCRPLTCEDGSTPSNHKCPTPTTCVQTECVTGEEIKCCDTNNNGKYTETECTSPAVYQYLVKQVGTIGEACGIIPPTCAIGVDPQVLDKADDILVGLAYYDLPSAPNSVAIDCGNGRTANAIGCSGTQGQCSAKCRYDKEGTYTVKASVPGTACNSMTVELAFPTPTPTVTPNPEDNDSNPPLPGSITLYLDDIGFADAYYHYSGPELTDCQLKGKAELTDHTQVYCLPHTVVVTADYLDYENLDNTFRTKGTVQLVSGTLRKNVVLVISGSKLPAKSCKDQPERADCVEARNKGLPLISDRIEFEIDPYNRYVPYTYSLLPLGQSVSGCQLSGFDSSISSWIQLQYCGAADQRLGVIADFTGQTAYDALVRASFSNNPYCAQLYGVGGQVSFGSPVGYCAPGTNCPQNGYSNAYGNQLPFNYGSSISGQYGLGYGQPYGSELPYYSQNGYGSYPVGQIYDSVYNFPQQYSYYNRQNTYAYQQGAAWASGLPSQCSPSPLSGFVTFTLLDGSTRRVQLIITARGVVPPISQVPQVPQAPGASKINSGLKVMLDPFSLSRYYESSRSFTESALPLCQMGFDAALYEKIKAGPAQNPYFQQYQQYGSERSVSTNDDVQSMDLSNAFRDESLCQVDAGKIHYSFQASVANAGLRGRQLSASGALNRKQDAYVVESYRQSGATQLTPIQLWLGNRADYDQETLSGPLVFVVTDRHNVVDGKQGQFKASESLLQSCEVSGLGKDQASASVNRVDGMPSQVDVQVGKFPTQDYVVDADGKLKADADAENAVALPIPSQSGKLSCAAQPSSLSSPMVFVSAPDTVPVQLTDGKLSNFEYPLLPGTAFPELSNGKQYLCMVRSSLSDDAFEKAYGKWFFKSFSVAAENWPSSNPDTVAKIRETFLSKADAGYDAFGCKVENGKLKVNLDYAGIMQKYSNKAKFSNPISDEVQISLSVLSPSPVSSLASDGNYATQRPLADLHLTVTEKGSDLSCTSSDIQVKFLQKGRETVLKEDHGMDSQYVVFVTPDDPLNFIVTFPQSETGFLSERGIFVIRGINAEQFASITAGMTAAQIREKFPQAITFDAMDNLPAGATLACQQQAFRSNFANVPGLTQNENLLFVAVAHGGLMRKIVLLNCNPALNSECNAEFVTHTPSCKPEKEACPLDTTPRAAQGSGPGVTSQDAKKLSDKKPIELSTVQLLSSIRADYYARPLTQYTPYLVSENSFKITLTIKDGSSALKSNLQKLVATTVLSTGAASIPFAGFEETPLERLKFVGNNLEYVLASNDDAEAYLKSLQTRQPVISVYLHEPNSGKILQKLDTALVWHLDQNPPIAMESRHDAKVFTAEGDCKNWMMGDQPFVRKDGDYCVASGEDLWLSNGAKLHVNDVTKSFHSIFGINYVRAFSVYDPLGQPYMDSPIKGSKESYSVTYGGSIQVDYKGTGLVGSKVYLKLHVTSLFDSQSCISADKIDYNANAVTFKNSDGKPTCLQAPQYYLIYSNSGSDFVSFHMRFENGVLRGGDCRFNLYKNTCTFTAGDSLYDVKLPYYLLKVDSSGQKMVLSKTNPASK